MSDSTSSILQEIHHARAMCIVAGDKPEELWLGPEAAAKLGVYQYTRIPAEGHTFEGMKVRLMLAEGVRVGTTHRQWTYATHMMQPAKP